MANPGSDEVEIIAMNFCVEKIAHYVCCQYIPSDSLVSAYNDAMCHFLEWIGLNPWFQSSVGSITSQWTR